MGVLGGEGGSICLRRWTETSVRSFQDVGSSRETEDGRGLVGDEGWRRGWGVLERPGPQCLPQMPQPDPAPSASGTSRPPSTSAISLLSPRPQAGFQLGA